MSDKGKRSSIRLSHEQQQMVEDNIGLVGYAIGHYGHQGLDTGDDTFQIGVIGLIQAVATYDPDRSIKFSTYAIPCILNELRREARRQMRGRGMILISLDKAMSDDATLKELLPDDALPIDEHVSNRDLVERVMQLLEHSDTTAARLTLDYALCLSGWCGGAKWSREEVPRCPTTPRPGAGRLRLTRTRGQHLT